MYRARDQKLGRDVAIKVLPEEFAKDTDRVARFQREAKLLASLNQPNVAAIHGLEEAEGTNFLVWELIGVIGRQIRHSVDSLDTPDTTYSVRFLQNRSFSSSYTLKTIGQTEQLDTACASRKTKSFLCKCG